MNIVTKRSHSSLPFEMVDALCVRELRVLYSVNASQKMALASFDFFGSVPYASRGSNFQQQQAGGHVSFATSGAICCI